VEDGGAMNREVRRGETPSFAVLVTRPDGTTYEAKGADIPFHHSQVFDWQPSPAR
jgi:hypothetical protein